MEYSINRFLKDLTKIRNNTFKNSTIRHAFRDSGMWPVSVNACLKKMKTYTPNPPEDESPSLPTLPRHSHPQQVADIEFELKKWGSKIKRRIEWSDPVRGEEFDEFLNNSQKIITNAILNEGELQMWQSKRTEELHGKRMNRKRLKPQTGDLGLSKEDALAELASRAQKEEAAEKKRVENNFMKIWRWERDQMHAKGIAARKAEKARLKQVKEMMKGLAPIPDELNIPIPDPEAEWKATNVT